MVSSLENTLTDQRKTSDEIQDSLQLQLKDREETSAKMTERVKNLEEQKNKLIDEKVRIGCAIIVNEAAMRKKC